MVSIMNGIRMDSSDIVNNMIKVFKMENKKNGIVMEYYQGK